AHCVYDQSGTLGPVTSLSIRAGISSFVTPLPADAEQDRAVSSLRVHPGYVWSTNTSADDVAMLALSEPLDLGGPRVQAGGPPAPGAPFPRAADAGLAGFGRQLAGAPANGSLVWLTTTIGEDG